MAGTRLRLDGWLLAESGRAPDNGRLRRAAEVPRPVRRDMTHLTNQRCFPSVDERDLSGVKYMCTILWSLLLACRASSAQVPSCAVLLKPVSGILGVECMSTITCSIYISSSIVRQAQVIDSLHRLACLGVFQHYIGSNVETKTMSAAMLSNLKCWHCSHVD